MGKIKIKMATIALVAIVLTLFRHSTLAYYQAVGKATNVVTSDNIRFIIHEMTDQGKEFPKEGVYILPGDIVSKKVSIESDCEHPFYLRVKMVYSVDSQELSSEDCFKLNIDEEHWVLHDGWYYYTGIVNQVLADLGSDSSTAVGALTKGEEHTITIPLKMRETTAQAYGVLVDVGDGTLTAKNTVGPILLENNTFILKDGKRGINLTSADWADGNREFVNTGSCAICVSDSWSNIPEAAQYTADNKLNDNSLILGKIEEE